mmetsp:Transcript_13333/g.14740  ORF Transcript_13333/g.14740 Transcript_13333/m.14740 type:complete len:453 (-) Transcript_13333:1902-3260(-)
MSDESYLLIPKGSDKVTSDDLHREPSSGIEDKNWFIRTFSPPEKDSLRVAVNFLVTSCVAGGFVSLPYGMLEAGVLGGLLLFGVGALLCFYSLNLLFITSRKTGINDYGKMVEHYYGKIGGASLEILVIVTVLGGMMSHNVLGTQLLAHFSHKVGIIDYQPDLDNRWEPFRVWTLIGLGVVQFVVSLVGRDPSKLRMLALMDLGAIFFAIFVVVIESPFYISENFSSENVEYFKMGPDFWQAFSLICFSYSCSMNSMPAKSHMRNPSKTRLRKVAAYVSALVTIIYAPFAVVAYLAFLDDTPQVILDRPSLHHNSPDIAIQVARIGMVFTFCVANISLFICVRVCFQNLLKYLIKDLNTSKKRVIFGMTLFLFGVLIFSSIVLQKVVDDLSLVGGSTVNMVGFIYPSMLYLKVSQKPWHSPKKLGVIVLMIALIVYGVYITTYDILQYLGDE